MLKYPPFAASARLGAAAQNHRPLVLHERGPAVAIFQGGLVQVGIPLPTTTKKGVPDGVYGPETFKAVKSFQIAQSLAQVDGFAGRDTITTLDAMLASAAGMSFPIPLGPPSSSVDPNFELGNTDPRIGHDPGAGVWNSSSTEMSYVALKASIIASLPGAAAVIGVDATKNMWHYLADNDGAPQTIDLEGMVRDVPSAKERYKDEVEQAKRYVETLIPGTYQIRSKMMENGYNYQKENTNWFFAIGGYSSWGRGTATVAGDAANRTYAVDFEYKFYDRYNWDAGKKITFHGITVTDKFMGEFHRQGLAQEYDCFGSFKRRFTWKKGEAIPPAQLDTPAVGGP